MSKKTEGSKLSEEAKTAANEMRGVDNFIPPIPEKIPALVAPPEEYFYEKPEPGIGMLDVMGAVGICLGFIMTGFSIALWVR